MKELNFEDLEFKNQEAEKQNNNILEHDVTINDIIWQKTTDDNFYTNFSL